MMENMDLSARLQHEAARRSGARKKETATLLGQEIEIRSIMVGEKHQLIDESFSRNGKKLEPIIAKLVPALLHKSVHDPATGKRAFASPAAVTALLDALPDGGEEAAEVQKVVDLAMKVSGLNEEATKEAEKNSEESGG